MRERRGNLDGATATEGPGGKLSVRGREKGDVLLHNFGDKDIVYRAPPPPHPLRPHMPVGSAGMSLCSVRQLERGYCWLLTKRISLFSPSGQRKAEPCSPVMMMMISSIGLQPKQYTETAPPVPPSPGVPSALKRTAAHMLAFAL